MSAYYNEVDRYAAQWLRNLIAANLIAPGDVDERSIIDVRPEDLHGYAQCHFFAGIGGWSLALRLAGWPDDQSVWTGSCPCQPFSLAGRGKGFEDSRHLWPDLYRLVRPSRPPVLMGEQVANTAGYAWLDMVLADLEAEAYTGRAVDIPSCSIGSKTPRNRIYWMAHASNERLARSVAHGQGLCGGSGQASTKLRNTGLPVGLYQPGDPCAVLPPDALSRPVGIVRAFGNAIDPELAAEVIRAYMEATA